MHIPHDHRTRCHRCDSPNWCSIGICEDCEQDCCTDCASPELEGLVCSQCALERALEAAEVEHLACPQCQSQDVAVHGDRAVCQRCHHASDDIEGDWIVKPQYKLVEPMQGVLFEEMAKKPAKVQVSPIYREEVA